MTEVTTPQQQQPTRPYRLQPPPNAAELIRAAAAKGSRRSVAGALGVHRDVLARWFREHPELQRAFDEGFVKQEQEYVDKLRAIAMDDTRERDQVIALLFLLKARFGWREGDPGDAGSRTSVTISLPAAQTPQLLPEPLRPARVIDAQASND